MSLQKKLRAFRENFESGGPPLSASPGVIATMQRATEGIRASGMLGRVMSVGSKAPDFSLPNTDGQVVRFRELLSRGPLVISFFRGIW